MDMDADKHKDTLLYAKFLANVKDKWWKVYKFEDSDLNKDKS
jgi:hypothetical protein